MSDFRPDCTIVKQQIEIMSPLANSLGHGHMQRIRIADRARPDAMPSANMPVRTENLIRVMELGILA